MSDKRQWYRAAINRDINLATQVGCNEMFIIAGKCCEECDKIDKKVFSLKDVKKLNPLPHKKCIRNGGCVCSYGFGELRENEKPESLKDFKINIILKL